MSDFRSKIYTPLVNVPFGTISFLVWLLQVTPWQGRLPATLAGGDVTFQGADMSTKLKLMGVDVGSIGDAHARTEGALTYTYENQPESVYKKIVVSSDHKKLLGSSIGRGYR